MSNFSIVVYLDEEELKVDALQVLNVFLVLLVIWFGVCGLQWFFPIQGFST